MENFDRKKHWENIYETKELKDVSWYQPTPETSIQLINSLNLSKDAKIIDIGGGDSFLVDHLIDLGYLNITVLDISIAAINRAKKRLGEKANTIQWIVSDITQFQPTEKYDVWHDRAAFHFLTAQDDVQTYTSTLNNSTSTGSHFILGTFSDQGPTKCSGIEIKQYTKSEMINTFQEHWTLNKSNNVDHPTPFNTTQNFIFSLFDKIN